jgi:hypothetical protein
LKFVVAVVVLFACFDIGRSMFWLPSIPSHHGDGVFQDLSHRAGPFPVTGYCISMAEFELANPHQAEYRLGGLPNIGRTCGVHLAIRDHDDRWYGETRHLNGKVQLDLLNSHEQAVVSVCARLGDYI